MTKREFLARMTSAEITELAAYDALEPFGDFAIQAMLSQVLYMLHLRWRGDDSPQLDLRHFLPGEQEEPPPASPEVIFERLRRMRGT